ncbi:gluconate 2-dehydrogenase subunit 3 family protein [Pedobacter antarcticus]|uniref:Twin-arginine translocation pathway signal protein n=2 Tax=Pedobacter antarcticus TaxID=34086 RepID=A0A081PE40_9SPHI|nr:gluconate 2-dehydrogenase subunit 3 family protein [Pedobacter antarcticus]KEQ28963.1 twin-arginine translocation pathway signal protein [Pedobacter antarcticus 4BY]SDM55888.1 Gluconate 2-dehydrogenase subunit 3 [Pedobacter antarcticus]SFF46152.1 Gluconate 2-dehydrogenase subunit 3 [Pedobacter antarcticus]
MNRRHAVKNIAFLMGGALSATTIGVFLDSCNPPSDKKGASLFSSEQDLVITELADTIIPTTKTPGAKAAGVGPFISMMMAECYPKDAQDVFVKGLDDLEARSKKEFNNSFAKISAEERKQLVGKLRDETIETLKKDNEQAEKDKAANKEPKKNPNFFAMARDLTLLGYFTSEIGATKAYEYVEIPGRYDGCVDLKPGQRVYV